MILALLAFFVGASLSSFFNVVIERRERGESWVIGRSRCDHCGKIIPWYSLIPVAGYFLSSKTCSCGGKISPLHPLTETFGGFVAVLVLLVITKREINGFLFTVLMVYFLFLSLEDIQFKEVYTSELFISSILILVYRFIGEPLYFLSGLFIFFLLGAIYLLFPEGFGEGDLYFGSLLALLLPGVWMSYLYFTISFILAAIVGLTIKWRGYDIRSVPMFPFLLMGCLILYLF